MGSSRMQSLKSSLVHGMTGKSMSMRVRTCGQTVEGRNTATAGGNDRVRARARVRVRSGCEAASACGQENTPPGPGDIVGRTSGLGPSEPGGLVEADAGDDASAASPALPSALCCESALCCDASAARCCATPPGGMALSSTLCSCSPRASSSSVNELVRCMAKRRLKLRASLFGCGASVSRSSALRFVKTWKGVKFGLTGTCIFFNNAQWSPESRGSLSSAGSAHLLRGARAAAGL